jgi:isopenicillin-N epimerase
MIASMATFPLPPAGNVMPVDYKGVDPLQETLYQNFRIEIPVWNWTMPSSRLIRIAVQLYNSMEQFDYLASVLRNFNE